MVVRVATEEQNDGAAESSPGRTSMFEGLDPSILSRLQAVSFALPVEEALQDLADEVVDLDQAGRSSKQVNRHIRAWMDEHECGFRDFEIDLRAVLEGSPWLEAIDAHKLWNAFGYEQWLRECVRSIAYTYEPTPFHPFAMGFWIEDPNSDPPVLIAVMTPLSDPQLAARQVIEKHRKVFGNRASGSPRKNEVENARMLSQRRAGMPVRDIAIQNLRNTHPDIVTRHWKYKVEIDREVERVKKILPSARQLWKERGLESSPED